MSGGWWWGQEGGVDIRPASCRGIIRCIRSMSWDSSDQCSLVLALILEFYDVLYPLMTKGSSVDYCGSAAKKGPFWRLSTARRAGPHHGAQSRSIPIP
jgi:hypothetical protein